MDTKEELRVTISTRVERGMEILFRRNKCGFVYRVLFKKYVAIYMTLGNIPKSCADVFSFFQHSFMATAKSNTTYSSP